MRRPVARLALVLLAPFASAHAADYWTYQYKNLDITVGGEGSDAAVKIAHNIDRLDDALFQILSLKTSARLPTHIYVLPETELKQLLGRDGPSYKSSGYDTTVITPVDTRGGGSTRYWGAYFGYVGSLLAGDNALRFPYWFRLGVPEVFSATEFEYNDLKTGGLSARAYGLGATLIPMRTFLRLKPDDPQLREPRYAQMYSAESWYVAREYLVEGRYREEFARYLTLLHEGRSESDAFAASFPISYEDLDKTLLSDMHAPIHFYRIPSPHQQGTEQTAARRLTTGEAKARLALMSLGAAHRPEALRLATEALQAEPTDECALRVLALVRLEDGDYAGALSSLDQLAARGSPSADALGDSGDVLRRLAAAETAKQATLAVDADALGQRARTAYRAAIAANGDDLRSWAGIALLYGDRKDQEGAKAILTSAEQVLQRHPRNVTLAYALTTMCAQTNQPACALKYAGLWRENAPTDDDRDRAAAYQAQLQKALQRPNGASGAGLPTEGAH